MVVHFSRVKIGHELGFKSIYVHLDEVRAERDLLLKDQRAIEELWNGTVR